MAWGFFVGWTGLRVACQICARCLIIWPPCHELSSRLPRLPDAPVELPGDLLLPLVFRMLVAPSRLLGGLPGADHGVLQRRTRSDRQGVPGVTKVVRAEAVGQPDQGTRLAPLPAKGRASERLALLSYNTGRCRRADALQAMHGTIQGNDGAYPRTTHRAVHDSSARSQNCRNRHQRAYRTRDRRRLASPGPASCTGVSGADHAEAVSEAAPDQSGPIRSTHTHRASSPNRRTTF